MCNYVKVDDHKFKRGKGINENVVDGEVNMSITKLFSSMGVYMRHEMNRIRSKDHNIGT